MNRSKRGFTLIELLITVAIIGILAAIAIPSYISYLAKSDIRAAQADLLALSLAFQSKYQRTLAYPVLANGATETDLKAATAVPDWSKSSKFTVTTAAATTTTTYSVKATGSGRTAGCWVQINETNTRTSSAAAACKHTDGSWL